jgi:hypothetical protein
MGEAKQSTREGFGAVLLLIPTSKKWRIVGLLQDDPAAAVSLLPRHGTK